MKNKGKFKNTFQVIIYRENKAYSFKDTVFFGSIIKSYKITEYPFVQNNELFATQAKSLCLEI